MMKKSLGGAVIAFSTVLATGVATATPPHGVAVFDNHARGTAVGSAVATITPGSDAYVGSYAMEPGSTAGWRAQPGIAILSVTQGTIRVVQAKGCVTREYKSGEAAVLPAGTVHVSTGGAAAKFVGYFDNLAKSTSRPLADGAEAKAPKDCAAGRAYRAASTGLSAVDIARGTFASLPAGHHDAYEARRLEVPEGGDVAMVGIIAAPGTSTGWYRHSAGLAIITKGRLDVYQATESGCAKVEEGHAGEAVSHAHHDLHLSAVGGTEPLEAFLLYWGMGNNKTPAPVVGNFLEANDFTPLPPNGCTTL
jgi:quercetin dioxygenase-like cupin family protein